MPEASIEAQLPYASIFVPGLWLYQYFQFNQTFGPFQQEIIFNPMTKKLKGRGIDNVGQYLLKGTFSDETGQIEMIQQYQVCYCMLIKCINYIKYVSCNCFYFKLSLAPETLH